MSRRALLLGLLLVLALSGCSVTSWIQPDTQPTPTDPPAPPSPTVTPTPEPTATVGPPATVEAVRPEQRRLDTNTPTIRITFDRPMDPDSVAGALVVEPTLPVDLDWQGTTLLITPTTPMSPGAWYAVTLEETARTRDGAPVRRSYRWRFFAQPVIAEVTYPTETDRDDPLGIRFNYPVDTQAVEESLTISPTVAGRWQWDEDGTAAIFDPAEELDVQTEYTVRFGESVPGADGSSLPAPDPISFETPPPILETTPGHNRSIHPATQVEIVFDRPMDRQATNAAFEITPAITGTLEWQETTLTFTPERGYFEPRTRYRVTVDTGARTADGEPLLRKPYVFAFRTGALDDVAGFGEGSNAQVVDVNGRRAVQFGLFRRRPVALQFQLYRLTLEQFLDRYSSGFRGVAGREDRPISTEGTELVAEWSLDRETIEEFRARGAPTIGETRIPENVPAGLYLLDLRAGHLNDQLILILTENVLTLKQAEGQLITWVTDVPSAVTEERGGSPVRNAEVSIYARDGELIDRGTTDDRGVYRTQVATDPQPLIAVARDGEDLTVAGFNDEWLTREQWPWWRDAPEAPDVAAYLYTDRPIYKPGQTVYFKGIIRSDDDAILSLPPADTAVTARIRDARDNVVRTIELATNEFGTVDGEFALAEGAMLGEYKIEIEVNDERHSQIFKVENYRKPDYEVTVDTDARNYIVGESTTVTVDSRYFFGEPVADAEVTIERYRLQERYRRGGDGAVEYVWYETDRDPIEATTDASGRFTDTVRTFLDDSRSAHRRSSLRKTTWGIEATVDDGSNQTVSSFAVIDVYDAAEKLRLDVNGYFHTPGRPFSVEATVATIDDEPVAGRDLTVEVRRWDRIDGDYTDVVRSTEVTTGDDGVAETDLTVEEPGYYQLCVSGRDGRSNEMWYTSWVYVFDEMSRWTSYDETALDAGADKEQYAPGETARLAIESDFSGPALLTMERGSVRHEQLVQLDAPLTVIELPIRADYAPNVFVTVNAWQEQDTSLEGRERVWSSLPDGRLLTADVELLVPVTDKTLNVEITPDRETYAPRDEATFTVRVTDEQGNPADAELSLAMVDEAIFSLSEELAGSIFDAFYRPRDNIVRTYDAMALDRYLGGGFGGGGGGGASAANPRSDFRDTAVWRPTIRTGDDGQAVITTTLPDNLTTWRLTAKAATVDTKVGEVTSTITTRQPVVVRPLLPRVLTAGDDVDLSALVHNYADEPHRVVVWLQPDSAQPVLDVGTALTQTIELAPGERRIVGWSAVAERAGTADLLIAADAYAPGSDERVTGDAVQASIPVQPLAVPDVETQVGEFTGAFSTTVDLPDDALPMSSVQIELSRSVAGSLLRGLDYLTGYPYGCVEQTMSRALPNAVVGRAFNQLGVGNPTLHADLPALINAGLQKLYGYQHEDGGWGWWYDDSTHDYQTAWVVFGLATTRDAGYEVAPSVVEGGVEWLRDHFNQMDPRTRAFALYSIAVAGELQDADTEAMLELAEQLGALDTFSRAALALALHEAGAEAEARDLLDGLIESATVSDDYVYWAEGNKDGKYYRKTMASDVRSTALALSAVVQLHPDHEYVPGIVRWLMDRRTTHGWGTTNETAFTVIALTDHLLATEQATADTTYRVLLDEDVVDEGVLGRGEPAVSLEIPAEQLASGENALRIEQGGAGRLYYTIIARAFVAESEIDASGQVTVSREYRDPTTGETVSRVRAGELVEVRLTVDLPDDGYYVIVEDNLPGGLEALNERLNTTSHRATAHDESRYRWQQYGYNHKEVHGDRVSFFVTEMNDFRRHFSYYARATRTGDFVAMPATVEAMYDLSTWGRSASDTLTVLAEPNEATALSALKR